MVVICTDYDGEKNGITAEQRRLECRAAMKILGCAVMFLSIKESELTEEKLFHKLSINSNLHKKHYHRLYIPAVQGGHFHHDLIGKAFDPNPLITRYATYTKDNLSPIGDFEIKPTQQEIDLKNLALDCYKSQFPWNKAHFDAVRGKSEFFISN